MIPLLTVDEFRNPEFWAALAIGLFSLLCLLYWLRSGGRRSR